MQQRIHIGGAAKTRGAQRSLACCNNARNVGSLACLGSIVAATAALKLKTTRCGATDNDSVQHLNLYRIDLVVTPYRFEP
jgi:hypothetical protein